MRVDLVSNRGLSLVTASASNTLLSELRVGTILQAVASRDPNSGQLFLNIDDMRYPTRVASGEGQGPKDGEKLQLRVLRNSPVLALETLKPNQPRSADDEVAGDALRKFVPRQASPALLSSNLALLARSDTEAVALPPSVLQAATKLWQAMPNAATLTDPEGLQQALARSGTFLESTLAGSDRASAGEAVVKDLKALMLQLSQTLREQGARANAAPTETAVNTPVPTPGGTLTSLSSASATLTLIDSPDQKLNELARQTDGALARLTTVQVANSSQDSPTQPLLIELPVRHEDRTSILRFRIEQEAEEDSPSQNAVEQAWTVEAAMDLGSVGGLHARISLTGHRIAVQLRADSPAVVESLAAQSADLEAILREAGLQVDRVVCLHGMPASDGARQTRLLDVHA